MLFGWSGYIFWSGGCGGVGGFMWMVVGGVFVGGVVDVDGWVFD